jgi:cytochrome c oxidase assembly protein subunit 15
LRRLAIASLVANVLIVVTGGAVRLTNSGLGCPTWPSCTSASLVPTKAYSFHGIIEFTNRQLTFVVGLLAALTVVAAWAQRRQVRLAVLAFLGIPAQAVLGGITVLTDLNPYAVACHFLLSMAVLFAYAVLVWRVAGVSGVSEPVPRPAAVLARALCAVTAAVLVIGTIVTGSGPHAGDLKAGTLHRIHVSSSGISQLHADAVMALIGVTVGMLAVCYAVRVSARASRAVWLLLAIELAQGVVGYTQYFLHVPPLLVALHMFGACLVWLSAIRVLFLIGGGFDGQVAPAQASMP